MTRLGDPPAGAAPKILTIDLERLPGEVTLDIWHPRDAKRIQYIHPDKWTVLPRTLCFSWKWHDDPKVRFAASWQKPDQPDYLARTSWELFDQADIVVTYNGGKADEPWLRKDWLEAELPPPMPYKPVDLYKVTAQFGYESRSLRHLCDRLGLPNKSGHYDAAEAKAAEAGNREARRNLRHYNEMDSVVTEQVYDYLGPWIKNHPHYGLYTGRERSCWRCGGEEFEPAGNVAAVTQVYAGYRCANTACQAPSRNNHRRRSVTMRTAR